MAPQKIRLSEDVSAVLMNHLPRKLQDPGAPLISCDIGDITFDHALLDLGASVNLLPTSIYEQFDIGELKPTPIILQLADRSIKTPRGLIEDVIIKVKDCYFPVDFLILDMASPKELNHTPIILGRPFLATAKANINCATGMMDISCGDQTVSLSVFKASQYPDRDEECHATDELIEDTRGVIHDHLEKTDALYDYPQHFISWPKDEPLLALQFKPKLQDEKNVDGAIQVF